VKLYIMKIASNAIFGIELKEIASDSISIGINPYGSKCEK